MRSDFESKQIVPATLQEYLRWFEGVEAPNPRAEQLKQDVCEGIRLLAASVVGGLAAETKLTHRQMCDMLLERGAELARSRAGAAPVQASDELVALAGEAITTGDKEGMLKLAEKIEAASKHPTVHPARRAAALDVVNFLRLNARST